MFIEQEGIMLKKIRKAIAITVFVLVTLLFVDFTGALHPGLAWLAKVQIIPAVLAVNVSILIVLAVLSLLFGRLYCSVICPLGILQDGISHVSGKRKGKKNRFRFSASHTWLRYGVFVLFLIGLVAGISSVVSLLDPYSNFGRMASNVATPIYYVGNNALAWLAERADSYAFYPVEVWIKSGIVLGVSIGTLAVIGILSWKHGRTYCNAICPVGTFLGVFCRFSLFQIAFDSEKCSKCGLCERNCKSSCIDSKAMLIDHSRCVTCFNCVDKCKSGAMKYTVRTLHRKTVFQPLLSANEESKEKITKRRFFSIAGLLAITQIVKPQQLLHVDGGLAELKEKKVLDRKVPIVPPGADSLQNMKTHCTACQLCVASCPNQVLRPSVNLSTFMQPEMSFEKGYCRPECNECSQVCPNNAIKPITIAEKTGVSIGKAIWIKDNCLVNTDKVKCTSCERHCPTGAISLIPIDPENKKSLEIPVVSSELCIGCGACEYCCPARPFSAMYVEGNSRHHVV